ncbi:hypothetical protein MBOT_00670 [Mycobacterium botniense]|uniref:Terminase n=1 Tax=Mycobacterium botniense TaxID=84962 RepID=A0A7I9XRS3_9MYCO|nr:hypothetical protein MBOT_00670 [Mycobacterium botniense]
MPANVLNASNAPLLVGDQEPRILVAPPAPTSAAAEAIELAEYLGQPLDPWQQLVLHNALGETLDGKWAAFEVGLTVPRQNGKSAVIEIRMVAGLLLWGEELVVYSAHEFKTVVQIMRRVERLLKESGEPYTPKRSHGEEGFVLGKDVHDPYAPRMMFSSRTKVSGRGLTGDTVILDEAMIIKPEAIGALMPTLASRRNPQLWYAGSAVDQLVHDNGHVFAGVRKRALDGVSPRLAYMEWSCEEGADPTSVRERCRSNPGVGYRITLEYIEDEYQAMLHTPKIFAVERLGIGDWPTLADTLPPPISPDVWNDLADTAARLAGPAPQVIAVDRAPDTKVWSIGGAQYTAAGHAHVEIGYNQTASVTEVVEKLVQIVTEADPVALVIDQRSPAAIVKPYLERVGIDPVMTNTTDLALACEGFLEAVLSKQISHSGQQILTDSVISAVKRDLPGNRFAWDKPPGGSIVQLMAVTLAHWGLLAFAKPPKRAPSPLMERQEPKSSQDVLEREFDAMSARF